MSLRLEVDAGRWRGHLRAYGEREPFVVPVVKGNGYGFGFERLLTEPEAGHWPELAVGTYAEAVEALGSTVARLVVLNPWRPGDPEAAAALASHRILHTVSRVEDVAAFATAASRASDGVSRAFALELLTSMRRHGVPPDRVGEAAEAVRAAGRPASCVALALHHPIDRRGGDPVAETVTSVTAAQDALERAGAGRVETVHVSHLSSAELTTVRAALPGTAVRPRVGTALWLGDRGSWRARADVVDVHPLARGDRFGYRQRRAPADGTLLVVSGGTTHGIAMESPAAPRGVRARGRTLALAGMSAGGLALSPFTWAGRKRWFAEPPHMQVSMLFLPASVAPPAVGDALDVEVRLTTVVFDAVVLH